MIRILVIGDLNIDILVDRPSPSPGDETRGSVCIEPGGSAATFARVASAGGAHVTLVGAVGQDLGGDMLVRSLESAGVRLQVARDSRRTGAVIAFRDGDERSMLCSRGANDALTAEAVRPEEWGGIDHLHLSGYTILSSSQRTAARAALEAARSRGIPTSLDPPPANLIRSFGVEPFSSEIAAVDWIFPNEREGALLTGRTDPPDIVDALAKRFAAGAITLGPAGARAWRGDDRDSAAVEPLTGIDSTGAGDAYAAGFVVALLETGDLRTANRSGCAAAVGLMQGRRSPGDTSDPLSPPHEGRNLDDADRSVRAGGNIA